MFENPRRGRQARNFTTNSRSQIGFRTDIFRKLTLGAPGYKEVLFFTPYTHLVALAMWSRLLVLKKKKKSTIVKRIQVVYHSTTSFFPGGGGGTAIYGLYRYVLL